MKHTKTDVSRWGASSTWGLKNSWWWLGSTFYGLAYVNAYTEWISLVLMIFTWYITMETIKRNVRYGWIIYTLGDLVATGMNFHFIFSIPSAAHVPDNTYVVAYLATAVIMGIMIHGDRVDRINDLMDQYSQYHVNDDQNSTLFNAFSAVWNTFRYGDDYKIIDYPSDDEGNDSERSDCETSEETYPVRGPARECETPSQPTLHQQDVPGTGHESMRSLRSGRKY